MEEGLGRTGTGNYHLGTTWREVLEGASQGKGQGHHQGYGGGRGHIEAGEGGP
jgi:hypothetical protein